MLLVCRKSVACTRDIHSRHATEKNYMDIRCQGLKLSSLRPQVIVAQVVSGVLPSRPRLHLHIMKSKINCEAHVLTQRQFEAAFAGPIIRGNGGLKSPSIPIVKHNSVTWIDEAYVRNITYYHRTPIGGRGPRLLWLL